ncbi:senescence/dehydration-associated protein At4g35985, chloroplastic-like [Cucurbita pepo subsp. pepo]|uniref:senescence/dehydration-associated protein At4g35985, chloroplastic-like n=1 Tax=Cucurbita pepo subsp. pepo TaxID=3664 RepID=UPI000C9D9D0F|nr:senescence/dehydration-associated protein At4g35985, chloroplastic-like [Cucurbita pepo subsp. pepo]
MGCFSFRPSKSPPPMKVSHPIQAPPQENSEPKRFKQEVLLQIPGCRAHLMDGGEALELANGEFKVERIMEDDVSLATIIKVGEDLQWPLTKDEPVVKLNSLNYLFSLPMKDGDPLSYGVTFLEQYSSSLSLLDLFLKDNSCFCSSSCNANNKSIINWKEYAPKIDDYNNMLAKAIAEGTGQIVQGIFKCSNSYANQVNKGGEMILNSPQAAAGAERSGSSSATQTNKTAINRSLKRVRNLSKTTEKLSKSMLDMVGVASGSVMGPVMKSQAGRAFFSMVPGQVLLASLDAVNKILDAAEAAEKQALLATTTATTRMVSNRFGESAGEATGDVLATAGHCANTAWNVFKIRKAINPASSVSAGALRNAAKTRSF